MAPDILSTGYRLGWWYAYDLNMLLGVITLWNEDERLTRDDKVTTTIV